MKTVILMGSLLMVFAFPVMAEEQSKNRLVQLQACPDKPNCVSSEMKGKESYIEPLAFIGSAGEVSAQLKSALADIGGKIEEEREGYIAATFTSRIFRFVDDVEVSIDGEQGVIHVRSASRVGYSDLGVNRKRVEKLREAFERLNKKHAALSEEAMKIVGRFVASMQPQLQSALQSGGPAHAIEVCSVKAQEVAKQLSAETGWQVKRVSLKNRNAIEGVPDEWERNILEQFDQRQQQGEPAVEISYAGFDGKAFRFMKAQGVMPICLNCHGENLTPEVQQALEKHFPGDKATGYQLGQVRGAFSLAKEL